MDPLIGKLLDGNVKRTSRARVRRAVASGVILTTMAVASTALVTGAVFTDTERVDGSQFTTGTVDVSTTPTTTILESPNLAPGDTVTGVIEMKNSGSLEYRYAATDFATNEDGKELHTQLQLAVYAVSTRSQCTKSATSSMTPLGSKAGVSLTEENLFGKRTQGADTGDRTLASGDSELLCVRVDLPLETPNAFQAASSSLTFGFYAEQTANNA